MSATAAFDDWARAGRDRGMEVRHWHTAKHVLARMPIEPGETVLDLGCGSGYAARAMRELKSAGRAFGLDGAPQMARNAREYTDDPRIGFVVGDFQHLPFETDAIDHCFSMEAFYYARDPLATLREVRRVLRPGGTFHCAVNFYEENHHSHHWPDNVGVDMVRWSGSEYRDAFRDAGFVVASQDNVPDTETEIPPTDEFPTGDWDSRAEMVERYRELGTLLTVGVAP